MRNRSGFTMIEVALVTTIVGLLSLVAYPKVSDMRERSDVDAARRRILSQLNVARASAVQRGRRVEMRMVSNTMWLTASNGVTQQVITKPVQLDSLFSVSVSATATTVAFDSRGFSVSLPNTGAKYVLTRGEYSDSICVTKLGTVLTAGCGL